MSGEVNVIPTLREIRGGASPSKFGGGQSRDIFRGGPVKKITLHENLCLFLQITIGGTNSFKLQHAEITFVNQ